MPFHRETVRNVSTIAEASTSSSRSAVLPSCQPPVTSHQRDPVGMRKAERKLILDVGLDGDRYVSLSASNEFRNDRYGKNPLPLIEFNGLSFNGDPMSAPGNAEFKNVTYFFSY
jgi:hypothetical protein